MRFRNPKALGCSDPSAARALGYGPEIVQLPLVEMSELLEHSYNKASVLGAGILTIMVDLRLTVFLRSSVRVAACTLSSDKALH